MYEQILAFFRKQLGFILLSSLIAVLIMSPGIISNMKISSELSTTKQVNEETTAIDTPSEEQDSPQLTPQAQVHSEEEQEGSPLEEQNSLQPNPQAQVHSEDKKTVPSLPERPSDSEQTYQQTPEIVNNLPEVEKNLGHFPYKENQQQLVKVADFYGREEFLDQEAAWAFQQMQADAKVSGIDLTIISGFRSISQQEKLFARQINRRGSKEAAARLSAPPGFSEHHTGYALDIGEGENIDTFLKFEFEQIESYSNPIWPTFLCKFFI